MRGRKAAVEHLCDKKNPDKLGKWKVKSGQKIVLTKPSDKESWDSIMSQRILVECDTCKAVKYCLLEKLNENHFSETEYEIPKNFWTKSVEILEETIASSKESPEKIAERKSRIEKTAAVLASKASAMRKAISEPSNSVPNIEVSSTKE